MRHLCAQVRAYIDTPQSASCATSLSLSMRKCANLSFRWWCKQHADTSLCVLVASAPSKPA